MRVFPVSVGQERLLYLAELYPDNPFYNAVHAYRLAGPLDRGALERALHALAARHEPLRTRFGTEHGGFVQLIDDEGRLPLRLVDLAGTDGDAEETACRLAADDALEPFEFAAEVAARATLFSLARDDHVLLIVLHHLLCDAFSIGNLERDLRALYVLETGGEADLPALAVEYSDYAVWERATLDSGELESAVRSFVEELGDVQPAEFPSDRPRAATRRFRGATSQFDVPAETSTAVATLARSLAATPFMVLLAAFGVTLARWSGRDVAVVGTPVSGRTEPELEPLIGFLANTMPLRVDVTGDPPFHELVTRIRGTTLRALGNQHVPLDELVRRLRPARSLARQPLFEVLFQLLRVPDDPAPAGDLAWEWFDVPMPTTRFEQAWDILQRPDGFGGVVTYDTELFDASTVEDQHATYGKALAAALADPDRRVSEIVPPTSRPHAQPTGTDGTGVHGEGSARTSPERLTPTEQGVLEIWRDLFDGDVEAMDDFFEIGGHSLLAVRLISELNERFGVKLPLRAIFDGSTVIDLAAAIDSVGQTRVAPR